MSLEDHGSDAYQPRASLEAIEAANRVTEQGQICEDAYGNLGEAEVAFQRGGDPSMSERRARTWVQAAWEVGFAQRGLHERQQELEEALGKCGLAKELVDGIGAAVVVKLEVGDELPLPQLPDSGSPTEKFLWSEGEIQWITPPPGREGED